MSDRRIAVLVDNIEADYHVQMLEGVLRGARPYPVKTVVIAGGWLDCEACPTHRNFVYDWLKQAQFDGVLVMAGSLSNFAGIERLKEWLAGFGESQVLCIGIEVDGFPSIHVDNRRGMYDAILHLIDVHGLSKIGFCRGPSEGLEAAARYEAYQQALSDRGLELDERLVVDGGSLSRIDGYDAVRTIFGERQVALSDVQGMAGVNDEVTLGILESLTERGIAVPSQIALVGFDDTPNARAANPPISTVSQRVSEQGFSAASMLCEALSDGTNCASQTIESLAVFRNSCGCQQVFANDSRTKKSAAFGLARTMELALVERRDTIHAELARAAAGRLATQSGWERRLLNALVTGMNNQTGEFVLAVERLGRDTISQGGTADAAQDVLTAARIHVMPCAELEPELRPWLEDLFQEARLRLTRVALNAYKAKQQAAALHLRIVAKSCLDTMVTGNPDPMIVALREQLPSLGVRACTVSYLVADESGEPERLQVVMQVAAEIQSHDSSVLPLMSLGLDDQMRQSSEVVVMPLDFDGAPVGIVAFRWGAHDPVVYEQLRELISAGVYGVVKARASV